MPSDYIGQQVNDNTPFQSSWSRSSGIYTLRTSIVSGSAISNVWLGNLQLATAINTTSSPRITPNIFLTENEELNFRIGFAGNAALNQNFQVKIEVLNLIGQPICVTSLTAAVRKAKATRLIQTQNSSYLYAGLSTAGRAFGVRRNAAGNFERVWLATYGGLDPNGGLEEGPDGAIYALSSSGVVMRFDTSTPTPTYGATQSTGIGSILSTGDVNPLIVQKGFNLGIIWSNSGSLQYGSIGGFCLLPGSDMALHQGAAVWAVRLRFPFGACGSTGSYTGDLVRVYYDNGWQKQAVRNWVGPTTFLAPTANNNVIGLTQNGRLFSTYTSANGTYNIHRFDGSMRQVRPVSNAGGDKIYSVLTNGDIVQFTWNGSGHTQAILSTWVGDPRKIVGVEGDNPLYGVTDSNELFIVYTDQNGLGQAGLGIQVSDELSVDGSGSAVGVDTAGQVYRAFWSGTLNAFDFEYLDIY